MSVNTEEMLSYENQSQSNEIETGAKLKQKQKTKTTLYLTEEAEIAFTELYIHRLRKDRKIDKSTIACEALLALYENECLSK